MYGTTTEINVVNTFQTEDCSIASVQVHLIQAFVLYDLLMLSSAVTTVLASYGRLLGGRIFSQNTKVFIFPNIQLMVICKFYKVC